MKAINAMRAKWWHGLIFLCLAAVAVQRIAGAEMRVSKNLAQIEADEGDRAKAADTIRYLCVGKMAFDLKDGEPINILEDSIVLNSAVAKEKCALPFVDLTENAEVLMTGVSPTSGYLASLIRFTTGSKKALELLRQTLEQSGWKETKASKIAKRKLPALKGRMFERSGGWLLATIASTNSNKNETEILLAGAPFPASKR